MSMELGLSILNWSKQTLQISIFVIYNTYNKSGYFLYKNEQT